VLAAISQGAAQSWQMQNRGPTMLEGRFDFGFAVDWMRKDLALVMQEAQRCGAQIPVAELVDRFYAEIQAQGGQRWDTSSLIQRLR
jgi:3-hydroxyisobutyrate dehydrogenase-like beta-hydroxyacid dehydrogenase